MTGSHMYWSFAKPKGPDWYEAWGGLVNIDRRVRNAEISLIVNPKTRGKGFGTECVDWILQEGFQTQNMKTIYGEVYNCGAVDFWDKVCRKYSCYTTMKPNRAYWGGMHWNSTYFSIDRKDYESVK